MNNIATRTLTGLFFVSAIIGSILWHPLAFSILMLFLLVTGLVEFFRMTGQKALTSKNAWPYLVNILVFAVISGVALGLLTAFWLSALPVLILSMFLPALFSKNGEPVQRTFLSMVSVVYLTIPFAVLAFFYNPDLQGTDTTPFLLLGYLFMVWLHDIFAYLTGLAIGKHKLYERISPKKTWEGSVGGLTAAMLASWGLSVFIHDLSTAQWVGMAVIIAITGTLGDLSESLLKRNFALKDSGKVLPGHGGVLDRSDAMIFSAPAVFCYLVILLA